jgi:ATP-binding cassette, subfamily B, bacterial
MKNPYFCLLHTAWLYACHERRRFLLIYGMFIIANIIIAVNPILYGWFIDKLQQDGLEALSHAWIYAGIFLGLRLLEWSFHGPARVMERELAFNVSANFLRELYHQVLHMPINWHHDHHSGSTINRIRKGYESLKEFFQHGFVFLHAMGKFFFSFIAILYFSPLFGSIAVLLGMFTVWIIFKFDKPFIKSLKEVNEGEHVMSSALFDSLSNIITVITLRLEKRMEINFFSKVLNVFSPFRRNVLINELKWFTAQMLVGLIYTIIVVGYIYQQRQPGHPFHIGGLVTLLVYVNQFTSVFNDIAYQYTRIIQYNTDVQAAGLISKAYHQDHRLETSGNLPSEWRSLEIEHLSFFRSGSLKNDFGSLRDIHIRLERGQKVAFIGESGGGKSTLLSLLRGLYNPHPDTRLKVDGKTRAFADISNTVTLFPQDPEIFENSILYNITLGLPFENEEVMKVCDIAHFADVANCLPRGLETHIKEKGVNLSGGQKQRLALARGILTARSSNIVLLDEPTSSVDPRTEAMIYEKLFKEFRDKAIVSSLHRLHLLKRFDYVYILENGRITDHGTFSDLRVNSLVFKRLWQHQEGYDNRKVVSSLS